jgi:hypothetical protein
MSLWVESGHSASAWTNVRISYFAPEAGRSAFGQYQPA